MTILLYGAAGYTGKLIARRAQLLGAPLILAARDGAKVKAVAQPLGFEHRAAALDDAGLLDTLLHGVSTVLHAAGPFSATSRAMADACLRNKCHYADITGEIAVFESMAARDGEAKAAGVTLIPGVGFDVVPSDCLAAHVAARLPDASHLVLALAGLDSPSRGTAKTAVEGLGLGTPVRRGGRIVMLGRPPRRAFDFGHGTRDCIGIGWGDVSTAWHSTHIPDIEVYFEASRLLKVMSFLGHRAGGLMRRPGVQRWLKAKIDQQPEGPSDAARARSGATILAIADNGKGGSAAALLRTPDGYTLTAATALDAALRLDRGEARPGFFTPSRLFGADYVLGFEGVTRTDR
jgi:short subunit dehydrogenase-like uncharacterized protein